MNGSKRRTPLIAAALLGVAVIGLAAALVVQRMAIARASTDVRDEKRALADSQHELAAFAEAGKNYGSLTMKLGGRLRECSWSDQMPFVLSQLTAIFEPMGVKIETLQPQPMTTRGQIERFPLRIGAQCGLEKLAKALREIGKTTPALAVERLDIRKLDDKSGKLKIDVTVSSFVVLDKNAPIARRRQIPKPPKKQGGPNKPAADKKPGNADKEPKVTRKASEARKEDGYEIIASRNLFRGVRLEELAAQPSAPKLPPLLPMPVAPIPPPGPPPRPGSETDSFKKNIAFTGLVETSAGTQALLENLANKEFCFVSRGDNAFGCRVVSISPKSVSLEKDGAPFTLSLGENKPDVEATAPPKPSGGAPPPGEQKPGQPREK